MTYVLDACALLAFLNDESGAEEIETILNRSNDGDCTVSMHINNLLEVFYESVLSVVKFLEILS